MTNAIDARKVTEGHHSMVATTVKRAFILTMIDWNLTRMRALQG